MTQYCARCGNHRGHRRWIGLGGNINRYRYHNRSWRLIRLARSWRRGRWDRERRCEYRHPKLGLARGA